MGDRDYQRKKYKKVKELKQTAEKERRTGNKFDETKQLK